MFDAEKVAMFLNEAGEIEVVLNPELAEHPQRYRRASLKGEPESVIEQLKNLKTILKKTPNLDNIMILKDPNDKESGCLFYLRKDLDCYLIKARKEKGVIPLALSLEKEDVPDFLNLLDDIIDYILAM